jgi:hypothetical protein
MVDKGQITRDATAVLTAWVSGGDDLGLVSETIVQIADEKDSFEEGLLDLTVGLVNVAGHLMVMLEKRGMSLDETLQHLGAKHLAE